MQPLSGNQRPDPLTFLMNMSLVPRRPRKMHLCRSSSNVPCLPSFLEMLQDRHILLTFDNVHNPLPHLNVQNAPNPSAFYIFNFEMCFAPQRRALFPTSQRPKVVRTCGAFNIFTSKCASRHNGMHFFDISTSKSGPDLMCFVRFDFEICFAPQRRALFRHLNFQKWSEREVALAFSVANVLRATMACNFFISHLASAALASLLFDPPEPQIIGTTQCFATFLPFRAPGSSFF